MYSVNRMLFYVIKIPHWLNMTMFESNISEACSDGEIVFYNLTTAILRDDALYNVNASYVFDFKLMVVIFSTVKNCTYQILTRVLIQ